MKKFKNLLFLSILCSLVLFTNCGDSDDPVAEEEKFTLTVLVSPEEGGSVSYQSGPFTEGTKVILTATANDNYEFKEWTGAFNGTTNPMELIMNADNSVTAIFEKAPVYLDENGITVKAGDDAIIGMSYELNGETYEVVDSSSLILMLANNEDVSKVVTSRITNMAFLINYSGVSNTFNQDISSWDVSNVTNMNGLFFVAQLFNQDISAWDVSKVTIMRSMFNGATKFNQNIGNWNVSNVYTMEAMFDNDSAFNQDISSWNVSNVVDMSRMFHRASSFNQDISAWDVSKVGTTILEGDADGVGNNRWFDFIDMFNGARNFDQDISSWDVSNVKDMSRMFQSTYWFNQDIGRWNVNNVTNMTGMFSRTATFNQDLGSWDVGKVEDMSEMFLDAGYFDQDISGWNVSNVTNMKKMFYSLLAIDDNGNVIIDEYSSIFNQNLSNWDVSNVIDCEDFSSGNLFWSQPKPNFTNCTE